MHEPVTNARRLRQEQTPCEAILWRHLRSRQMGGQKWRRQQPIDRYVVDFYCPGLRLVVELDGDMHVGREERDAERQAYLESQGLKVVRFTNTDIRENLDGVLSVLWELSAEAEAAPSPRPSPARGEGD